MKHRHDRYTVLRLMAYLIAGAFLGYAAWLWLGAFTARNTGDTQPNPTEVITSSTLRPSEQPAPVTPSYTVAKDMPRSIAIPSINVHGYIQRVAIDREGRIAVPNNIYFAGWFTNSALPGQPGVSIIDGHVHGRYDPGVFYELHKVSTGDVIRIQFGDHSWRTFTVIDKKSVNAANDSVVTAPVLDKKTSELRLITCEDYDRSSGTYAKRLIVYARQSN